MQRAGAVLCLGGVAFATVIGVAPAHADCVITTDPSGRIVYDCSGSAPPPTTAAPTTSPPPATTRPPVTTSPPVATTRPRVRVVAPVIPATSAPTTAAPTTAAPTTAAPTTAAPTTAAPTTVAPTSAAPTTAPRIDLQADRGSPLRTGPTTDVNLLMVLVVITLIGTATVGALMVRSARFG